MKRKNEREEKIEKILRLVWSSLESHLLYTHQKSWEGKRFHKDCVSEYSLIIKLLSELY